MDRVNFLSFPFDVAWIVEKAGVAESRYELLIESFEGSLRISQNHSAIQQRQTLHSIATSLPQVLGCPDSSMIHCIIQQRPRLLAQSSLILLDRSAKTRRKDSVEFQDT